MKKITFILALLVISAPALANDRYELVCAGKEKTPVIFAVKGNAARISTQGETKNFSVANVSLANSQADLNEFKAYIGEEAKTATGYALQGDTSFALWVATGKSGTNYLLIVGTGISLVGSDRNCQRELVLPNNSSGDSSAAVLLLLQILRQRK